MVEVVQSATKKQKHVHTVVAQLPLCKAEEQNVSNKAIWMKYCPSCDIEVDGESLQCQKGHYCVYKLKDSFKAIGILKETPHTEWEQLAVKHCFSCNTVIAEDVMCCTHCDTWLLEEAEKAKYETELYRKIEAEAEQPFSRAPYFVYLESTLAYVQVCNMYHLSWWQGIMGYITMMLILSLAWGRLFYYFAVSIVWGVVGMGILAASFDQIGFGLIERLTMMRIGEFWWFGMVIGIISFLFHLPAVKEDCDRI